MQRHEQIMQPILDLQRFAEENQYHGLIAGLGVALEQYIKEVSQDDDARNAALKALSSFTNDDLDPH